jgi:DNA-binding NarL/FixJ family response regulator
MLRSSILVAHDHNLVAKLCKGLLETELEMFPAVKLILLTEEADPELAAEAFRLGASGYLQKSCAPSEIAIAVRDVLRGMTYLSCTPCKDDINNVRRRKKKRVEENQLLGKRQRQVLKLLAQGKLMREIGGILKVTTRTVAFHKYQIMKHVGAKTNAELVRFAVRNHIVAP